MRTQIENQIKAAFTEYLVTGRVGIRVPKKAVDAYWEIFKKSLDWRLDEAYKDNPETT